jgi:outer membrane protein assembly factor BamD
MQNALASHSILRSVTAIVAHLLAFLAAGLIGGCGLGGKEYDETVGWTAQKLYDEAKDSLNSGNYGQAVKYFEKLEARYPYGRYAQQAQLEVAYAYYKEGEVAQAVAACDRFIKLHPNHANVDYAYYLKGLTNFNETQGLFAGLTREDPSARDPKGTRESFDAFRELVTRFPSSKYAADATARMKFLVNALAQHEVHVARWYMRRAAYVAAVNRAQFALKTYPETPAMEEALAIMVGGYGALGITELSDDARRILEKNYPQSKFTSALRKDRSGWWKYWE